jgi:hypothetical protein
MKEVIDIILYVIKRLMRLIAGFILGWIIYMISMLLTTFDGVLSMIFQPFVGAFFSGVFVFMAFIVGLLLRIPFLHNSWSSLGWRVLFITVASLLLMIFNVQIGLSEINIDPETNMPVKMMMVVPAIVCYFMAIFPIVNFPNLKKS